MTMTAREAFIDALNSQRDFPSDHNERELHRLSGAVWNDAWEMPPDERWTVRDLIPSALDADEWEAKGRTYSGAARLIRPTLKGAEDLPNVSNFEVIGGRILKADRQRDTDFAYALDAYNHYKSEETRERLFQLARAVAADNRYRPGDDNLAHDLELFIESDMPLAKVTYRSAARQVLAKLEAA